MDALNRLEDWVSRRWPEPDTCDHLRTSVEPFYIRLRAYLLGQGIDPRLSMIANMEPDDLDYDVITIVTYDECVDPPFHIFYVGHHYPYGRDTGTFDIWEDDREDWELMGCK